LIRQLFCYDWLNYNSHLIILFWGLLNSLGEDILYTVNEYQ
jgi:hypothetical protein